MHAFTSSHLRTDCLDRHVVFAPSKNNQYAAAGFPSISDAIASGNATEVYNQVAIVTYFVRGALATLKDFGNFFA